MNEVSEEDAIDAIGCAHDWIKDICKGVEKLRKLTGWKPVTYESPEEDLAPLDAVREKFGAAYRAAIGEQEKLDRNLAKKAVKDKVIEELAVEEGEEGFTAGELKDALYKLEKEIIRESALSGTRIDGRALDEIRDITIDVGLLPRAHGSALFTRGETQALVTSTLGTGLDEKLVDGLHPSYNKKYYLHYNFPPMCVGETRPIRGPSRREIGHGALAERSMLPVLPSMENFPYTLRVVSDVLMSNGSSSMASICGATLSMMDAGVQIRRPVAGIAMGMVESDKKTVVLSDILGDEDHAGDMDFKVAGTQKGITALQMDIKSTGVTRKVLTDALDQAREGRMHILKEMLKAIQRPRSEYNEHAPRIEVVEIKPDKIGMLIGPGGKNIRRIQEETGCTVQVDDGGIVKIFGTDKEAALAARKQVEAVAEEATLDKIYDGKVTSIKDFGAFLEIIPGLEGLCHVSELSDGFVSNVEDVVKIGEITPVKVIAIDPSGRVKLSRRAAYQDLGKEDPAAAKLGERPPRRDDDDRGGRPPRRDGGRGRDGGGRRDGGYGGGRPPRRDGGGRPPRRDGGRPPRRDGGGGPPRRDGGGRPPRRDSGGRPPRRDGGR